MGDEEWDGGGGAFRSLFWLSTKLFCGPSDRPLLLLLPKSAMIGPTLICAQGNFITRQIKSVISSAPSLLLGEAFLAASDRAFLLYGSTVDQSL